MPASTWMRRLAKGGGAPTAAVSVVCSDAGNTGVIPARRTPGRRSGSGWFRSLVSMMRTVNGGMTQSENDKPLPLCATLARALPPRRPRPRPALSESALSSETPRDTFRCQFVKVD